MEPFSSALVGEPDPEIVALESRMGLAGSPAGCCAASANGKATERIAAEVIFISRPG